MRSVVMIVCMIASQSCGNFVESGSDIAYATIDRKGGSIAFRSMSLTVENEALVATTTFHVRSTDVVQASVGEAFAVQPDLHFSNREGHNLDWPGRDPVRLGRRSVWPGNLAPPAEQRLDQDFRCA